MPLCLTDTAPQDRCLVQYAYDTQLAVLGSHRDTVSMVIRLQQNLMALSLWFSKNDLQVNAEKTQLILIGTKKQPSKPSTCNCRFPGRNHHRIYRC